METYDEAVQAYQVVKEGIKYALPPHWGSLDQTLREKKGHCGMKSEVLVAMLRDRGIKARYVEGRRIGLRNTWMMRILLSLGLVIFDAHIWVEAFIGNKWLTLDTAPDSGIAYWLGDTKPGTHLGDPKQVDRWNEIPAWYRDGYNMKLLSPLRFAASVELTLRRFIGRWHRLGTSNRSTDLKDDLPISRL